MANQKEPLSYAERLGERLKSQSEGLEPDLSESREIGDELYLSQATVRNHIMALLEALGAHSQLEVLAKARQKGLLLEPPRTYHPVQPPGCFG